MLDVSKPQKVLRNNDGATSIVTVLVDDPNFAENADTDDDL